MCISLMHAQQQLMHVYLRLRSHDSSVGLVTDNGPDGRCKISRRSWRFLSTPQCPLWLWGPPSLLSNGYRRRFFQAESGRDLKLTAYLHLKPKSGTVELYLHSPIRRHGHRATLPLLYLKLELKKLLNLYEITKNI
jgi:hypothetical protein